MDAIARIFVEETSFAYASVIFRYCVNCRLHIWWHAGGYCPHSPFLYVPADAGLRLHGYKGPTQDVCTVHKMDCGSWNCDGPIRGDTSFRETLLWVNYLWEIGWRP